MGFWFGPYIQGMFGNQEIHSLSEGEAFDLLSEACRIEFYDGAYRMWESIQVFGRTGANAIKLFQGAKILLRDFHAAVAGISGNHNASGVTFNASSLLQLKPGTVANLVGTGTDISINSTAGAIALTWANVASGYNDGAWGGVGALGVGGIVTVAVPNLVVASQSIELTYRDAAAGAVPLSAPVALRTATHFQGNGLATDTTSTFDWRFSSLGDCVSIQFLSPT
jgi:hypothetical protein